MLPLPHLRADVIEEGLSVVEREPRDDNLWMAHRRQPNCLRERCLARRSSRADVPDCPAMRIDEAVQVRQHRVILLSHGARSCQNGTRQFRMRVARPWGEVKDARVPTR